MREMGAICQIGDLQQNRAFFGLEKGNFWRFRSTKIAMLKKNSLWATFIENVARNRRK